MKAIVTTKYGGPDVLQLQQVDKPTPKDNEVLVKIHASSVTTADSMMRTGKPYFGRLFTGITKPKHATPGTGFAGQIETVGKDVTLFKVGDSVFGESIFGTGTNTEYVCVAENGIIAAKPDNITCEEATPICDGAVTSMNFLKNLGNIQPGQKVLINGASGSLGTAAVQLARHFEAEVTGVCSTANIELVKSLGADKVIDYTKEDFTATGETYDIIYDTVGKLSFSKCKDSLTENGAYISPVIKLPLLIQMLWTSLTGSKKKAKFSATGLLPVAEIQAFLQELRVLFEENKIKSVIDKCYPLEQVAEAHRYIDQGHKKGNIVITM
ncbi:NAD(P)-dependent alcohol dehydrogenase [Reichenbachiella sp. MALMAid0571]|uniref:NAD(P)-dependent alcohol dehydrogenase n=1 Tax=Reichenbachiella sp. MALMAid0571 TaxID=3143939 RepID=UPI0032DEF387